MDTEKKFLELQNTEHLEAKRRATVMGFLTAMSNTLGRAISSTAASKKILSTQSLKPNHENRQATENRSISFDLADTLQGKGAGEDSKNRRHENDDTVQKVADFIADETSFVFETSMVSRYYGSVMGLATYLHLRYLLDN